MKRILYKQYYRCETQTEVIDGTFGAELKLGAVGIVFNGLRNPDGTYSAVPSWFTESSTGFPAFDATWQMTPPAERASEYVFSWTLQYAEDIEYTVKLTMIDYCSVAIGCDKDTAVNPLTALTFLSREGGWPQFIFNGQKSFECTIPEAKQYTSTGRVKFNNARTGVYKGETLTSTIEDVNALDLLQSLQQSIQVYFVENLFSDEPTFKPVILLNNGEIIKRRTDQNLFEVTVKFIYAEEIQMQSQ